jgi:hypothetical protein
MHPTFLFVVATAVGGGAEARHLAPADLCVAALAIELNVRLTPDPRPESPQPLAVAVPGIPDLSPHEPALDDRAAAERSVDARGSVTYDWRLPVFRTRP